MKSDGGNCEDNEANNWDADVATFLPPFLPWSGPFATKRLPLFWHRIGLPVKLKRNLFLHLRV